MINSERVIAVIPARGGSKSIPGKNMRDLGGAPLVAWPIRVASMVPEIDRIIVSTDDERIARMARGYGAESYMRSPELATDEALVRDAIRELLGILADEGEHPDIIILLEPTCPFRTADDVRQCIIELVEGELDSVATFKPAELNPHRAWRLNGRSPQPFIGDADPWRPRQELPLAYQLNGAVYAFYAERMPVKGEGLLFGRSGAVLMPHERSIDIDHELDFVIAEQMLEGK